MLLKLYIYGYLNRVQSSRRLEREAQRNVELMWLTGKLAPDHKTSALAGRGLVRTLHDRGWTASAGQENRCGGTFSNSTPIVR